MQNRIPKYPRFRFTYRRNCIINDIESRNFLGIWQEGEIVISLPAILLELLEEYDPLTEVQILVKISDVILHEYLHHVLFKAGVESDHHWVIDLILE